jgi:hypothetical protein
MLCPNLWRHLSNSFLTTVVLADRVCYTVFARLGQASRLEERIATGFQRSERVSEVFEAVKHDGTIERIANQVSERVLNWVTLGSLAAVAEFEHRPSGRWSSRLNQVRNHRLRQVVTNHARDLDLFDRTRTYRRLSRVVMKNSLPAHSADNFQLQPSRGQNSPLTHRVRSTRLACGLADVRRRNRKKIYVKRTNC